jgi:hypothetical protein
MQILEKYKQYGFCGIISRLYKRVFRIFGIRYEQYMIMACPLSLTTCHPLYIDLNKYLVRELSFADFEKADSREFSKQKLQIIFDRFNKPGFYAYGVFLGDDLIYSCWLSTKSFEMSESYLNGPLDDKFVLFLDDYCMPEYRGRGIHSYMNSFRLLKAKELGKKVALVIILKENLPAFKSQKKAGFHVLFDFYTLSFGKKHLSSLEQKLTKFGAIH